MILSLLAFIVLSDYLVKSEQKEIYISNDIMTDDSDGSLLKPYRTLLEAFENNSNSNIKFWFSPGIHILNFELPENTIQNLSVTFKSSYLNPATLSIINPKFVFPKTNVIELNIENLYIEASNVDKSMCVSQKCGNCTYLFNPDLWYAIENSTCSREEEIELLNLIDLVSFTTLYITNSTFFDFNYDLRSIISTTGGKINLYNVNFYKISLYNTMWSLDFGVIRIACNMVNTCDDNLHYETGTVREIGNKIDEEIAILPGFLYANYSGTITIHNVEFEDNFYYNYDNLMTVNYGDKHFINIYDSLGQIIFTNNYFRHFVTSLSYIYIFYSENLINEKDIQNNTLIQSTNIIFENNSISSCYSDSNHIDIYSKFNPLNIKVSGNIFENCAVPYEQVIFYIWDWVDTDWNYDTMTIENNGTLMTFSFDPFIFLFENNKFFNVVHNIFWFSTDTQTKLLNTEYLLTKSAYDIIESNKEYAMKKNFHWFYKNTTGNSSLMLIYKDSFGYLEAKNVKFSSLIRIKHFVILKGVYFSVGNFSDFYIENLWMEMFHTIVDLQNFEEVIVSNWTVRNVTFDIDIVESDYYSFNLYFWQISKGKQLEMNHLFFDWDENGKDIYIDNFESVSIENIVMQNIYGLHSGSISVLNSKTLNVSYMYVENSAGINSCIYLYNIMTTHMDNLFVKNSKLSTAIYVEDPVNLSLKNIEIYNSEGEISGGIHIVSKNTINFVELTNIYIENTTGYQYSAGIYIESYVSNMNANNITMKDIFGGNYGGFVCDGCLNVHLENISINNSTSENTAGIHFTNTHIFLLINSNFDTVHSGSNTGCLHLEILNESNPIVIIDNVQFLKCFGTEGGINLSKNPSFVVELKIKNSNFIGGFGKSDASSLKISEWYHLSDESVIANCNFLDNYSMGLQGILNLRYVGFMTILNSKFQNNKIDSADRIILGFFKTSQQIMLIRDSKFINNSAKTIIEILTLFEGLIMKSENCEFTGNKGKLINLSKVIWKDYNSQFLSNENGFFCKSNTEVYFN